ncbi:MAG: DoxX family protein [Actinomycetota bacterium]|nr:DoxX family protein [Actinomycetota bacterium]
METIAQREDTRTGSFFRRFDIASLLLRAMIGVVFITHGAQKLFGAFGGVGLDATANAMAGMGLRPGMFFTVLAGILEFGGGLLLLVGLLTPLAGLIITGVMIVAIAVASGQNGFIAQDSLGYEYNLVLIAIALALVIAGPGRLSLDHQLGLSQAVANRVRRSRKHH